MHTRTPQFIMKLGLTEAIPAGSYELLLEHHVFKLVTSQNLMQQRNSPCLI